MVRIAGVDLPNNKRVEVALTYIHGIGASSSRRILSETGVSPDIRMHELSDEDLNKVRRAIESDYKKLEKTSSLLGTIGAFLIALSFIIQAPFIQSGTGPLQTQYFAQEAPMIESAALQAGSPSALSPFPTPGIIFFTNARATPALPSGK